MRVNTPEHPRKWRREHRGRLPGKYNACTSKAACRFSARGPKVQQIREILKRRFVAS